MKRSILENISANLFARLITYIFSFLTVTYAARVLQPEAFGKISFVSSFIGYIVLLANLGIPIYGMRLCAEKKNDKKELSRAVSELWSISVLLSVLSLLFLLTLVITIPRLWQDRTLFLIYGSGVLLQAFGFEWLFRGLEQFKFLMVCQLVAKTVSLLLMIVFIRSEEQLPLYAVLSVLTAYGSNVICFFAARKYVDFSFQFNRSHFKPLLIFFLMACAGTIYGSLDLTMLGFMKTNVETGLYSVAVKGIGALTTVSGVVWMSTLPQATRLWKEGKKEQFELLAGKTLTVVAAVQMLITVICWIFSRQIVIILGGESYAGAQSAFRILLLSLVPIGISNILGGQVLIPSGQEKHLLFAQASGAVVNFIANLFVIPIWSIEGAAATTVVSEIVVTGVCLHFAKIDYVGLIGKIVGKTKRESQKTFAVLNGKVRKSPFYCPCCDTHLNRFVEGDYKKWPDKVNVERYEHTRQDVLCPVCGSLPRHRILTLWCQIHIDELKKAKILYFAPEAGIMKWMKKNNVSCTTTDLTEGAELQLDIQDTGLADESYDIIFCNHVLEHVDDFRVALKEVWRILRQGGLFICSFPMDHDLEGVDEDPSIQTDTERIKRFGQADHKRVFGMNAGELLAEAGFDVEEIRGEDYDEMLLPVIGPANYDMNILFKCRKKVILDNKIHCDIVE